MAGAVAPLVAQALGGRDFRSVRRIVHQGIWVAVAIGLVLLPLVWNIAPVYRALGQDPELVALAEYFITTPCG